MVSIALDLHSHGYATPSSEHTRIPGIWSKLEQLYDLEILDERENVNTLAAYTDPLDPDGEGEETPGFELPETEFGDLMWSRRFLPSDAERSSSPEMPELQFSKNDPAPVSLGRSSVMSDADKDETVVQSSPPARGRGRPRGRPPKAGRGTPVGRASKAQSAVSESAEDEEEDEDDDEDEEDEESEDEAPTRGRGNRRGRGRRRGKR